MKFGFCVIRVYEELCRPQGLLNLSPIDELGHWCLQKWWSRAMLKHEEEASMATLQVAPTRHCNTEQFGGILTNQYLPGP